MDAYKILGVSADCTSAELKAAYRRAAQKHHPDRGGDAWAFQQVQQAFESVRDRHDVTRSTTEGTSPMSAKPHRSAPYPSRASAGATSPASARATPHASSARDSTSSATNKRGFLDTITAQLPLQNETSYFILVNVLDIVLTNMLLRRDAIEANPFAAYFLHRWGFNGMIAFKMVLVAFICVLAQVVARRKLSYARFILVAGIVIVGLVVVYSAILYSQHT